MTAPQNSALKLAGSFFGKVSLNFRTVLSHSTAYGMIWKTNCCQSAIHCRNYTSIYEPDYLSTLIPPHPVYDVLNIQMKSYDFTVLEHYQKYVHKIASDMGMNIADSWATPPQILQINTFKLRSSVIDQSYKLQLYERNVQDVDYHPCQNATWCGGSGHYCMQAFRRVAYKEGAYKFAYHIICYMFKNVKMAWEKAKSQCESEGKGVKLVEPRDATKNVFLTSFLKNMNFWGVIWIGGSGYNKNLTWQDGSNITYSYWNENDPSGRQAPNCIIFSTANNNTWKDRACNQNYPFICEYPNTVFL